MIAGKARRVTLFEDRAEVVRVAELELAPGTSWVVVAGVSAFVDERSIQARLLPREGEASCADRVLSARVRWRAQGVAEVGREVTDALEAEVRKAHRRLEQAGEAEERASVALSRARGLSAAWLEGARVVPRGARAEAKLGAWRDALASLGRAEDEALAQRAAARKEIMAAERAHELAAERFEQASAGDPRHEARVEVEIDAQAARQATLEITYRLPGALWRPEHVVRLAGAVPEQGGSASLEIVTMATAWQRTGEAWDDVEVRFSTARPARAATAPLLTDDVLSSRRKTDAERRHVEVAVRDQSIQVAGLDRGTRAVDEMPGVDDGGEPVVFTPRAPVTIASTGQPFRVEVQRLTVPAKIERVAFPEKAPVAHLRATATLAKGGPILAGPIRVARGQSLVGRAKIGFVGKGEPFEAGLGTDDGVRIRRTQTEERDVTPVIGTQKIRRKISVYLSNLAEEPKRLLVTERLPVSEIEDVEVTLLDAGGFRLEGRDKADGLLRREVDLGPGATQVLELVYEIRAAAKVVLPF